MKFQLLMIIAVIISSLMTISQRAYAHEANPFRWLEPSLEQGYDDPFVSDQDNENDSGSLAPLTFPVTAYERTKTPFSQYNFPIFSRVSRNLIPRAPPVSSI